MGRYPSRYLVDRVNILLRIGHLRQYLPVAVCPVSHGRINQYGKSICVHAEAKPQGAAVRRPKWTILLSPNILPSDARTREWPLRATLTCSSYYLAY